MKTIFLIAPHFPPSASPPAQRVRLIVKHCTDNDFYPHCFTVAPSYREETSDDWMVELLGKNYTLHTVNCLSQQKTRKWGIGDLGLRMLPYLFTALLKASRKHKPSFILYPVPPWYILIIAPIVKYITKVPYGIDFIDPWVHEQEKTYANFKHKASQYIARSLEKWICKNASIIFSVSEGINNNLKKRHKVLANIPMVAIPYGAEQADFSFLYNKPININHKSYIAIKYIGALWNDCYPVLDGLMPALAKLKTKLPIQVDFYGTSYAGEGLAKPQLTNWLSKYNMDNYVTEQPLRVAYKQAVTLTLAADLLFLIGGMQPYYAASKLMGLVAAQKPFVAFVHRQSFPAIFLKQLQYPYVVTYTEQPNDTPDTKVTALAAMFENIINIGNAFVPISLNHPLVMQHTAAGMTANFLKNISSIINN